MIKMSEIHKCEKHYWLEYTCDDKGIPTTYKCSKCGMILLLNYRDVMVQTYLEKVDSIEQRIHKNLKAIQHILKNDKPEQYHDLLDHLKKEIDILNQFL